MSIANAILGRHAGTGQDEFFAAVVRVLGRLLGTLACWQERAVQRRQLLALDARQLRDIGVDRATALEVGSRPFWRP